MIGKYIRLNRIINRCTGRSVIIPMDHGFTQGQINGLLKMQELVSKIKNGKGDAIIIHKGMVKSILQRDARDIGLIIHLSGSTNLNSDPDDKVLVTSVEEAVTLGADAVSIHINIGVPQESKMIRDAGIVSRDCNRWGIPLLIMAYPKGEKNDPNNPGIIGHCVRIAEELGADLIKTNYPINKNAFHEIVMGCSVPILVAGGDKCDDEEVFYKVKEAIDAGGGGVCIGRNVFQRDNTTDFVRNICKIVHNQENNDII